MKSLLTHAGALIERRRQRWSSTAALFALLAFGTPALSQNVPLLSNDYTLANNRKAWLESYVECGSVSCSIAYRIRTDPVDRYVQVVWKDTRGRTLVAGDNADLSNWWNPSPNKFTGYIEAIEWSRGGARRSRQSLAGDGDGRFLGHRRRCASLRPRLRLQRCRLLLLAEHDVADFG